MNTLILMCVELDYVPANRYGRLLHIPYIDVIDGRALFIFLNFIQNVVGY